MASSYLIRAARRARQEAELFAETNDAAAADFLWNEIEEAETLLTCATARMRLALRTHSISGFGETHDRMRDASAELSLTVERLKRDEDESEEADEPEDVAAADDDWEAFVNAHPIAPFQEQDRDEVALDPFSDDEVVNALKVACSEWRDYRIKLGQDPDGANRGVWASCVARVLAGQNSTEGRVKIRHGDVIRVGQRMGKLMRAGLIRCVSEPYESRRYVQEASVDV